LTVWLTLGSLVLLGYDVRKGEDFHGEMERRFKMDW
jgi:hypothetical protein